MKREQMESFLKSIDKLEGFGYSPEGVLSCIKRAMGRVIEDPTNYTWRVEEQGENSLPPAGNESGPHMIFLGSLICKCNLEETR